MQSNDCNVLQNKAIVIEFKRKTRKHQIILYTIPIQMTIIDA